MESRLTGLNSALDRADSLVEGLDPQVNSIRQELLQLEDILAHKIVAAAEVSQQVMKRSVDRAETLHELLMAVIAGANQQQEHMAASFETAISSVAVRANSEAEIIAATLASAASSSVLIRNELVSY